LYGLEKGSCVGNLNNSSIEEIWNSKNYGLVRKKIKGEIGTSSDFICKRCESALAEKPSRRLKILFLIFPPWGVETPPVGMGYLVEMLTDKKIEVEVFDVNIWLYNNVDNEDKKFWQMSESLSWKKENFIEYLRDKYKYVFDELEEKLKNINANIIAISIPTDCMNLIVKWAVRLIKAKDMKKIIILGGVSVTVKEQRELLLSEIGEGKDYCVIGEGEEVLREIVNKIVKGESADDIEGTIVSRSGQLIFNPKRKPVLNLDFYPFPTYKKFNIGEYSQKESIAVEWSRGCIGKCPFCDFALLSNIYKKKSPERIIRELEFYSKKLKKSHFSVVDSSVNADLKWLEKIVDLIIRKKLKINISALAIPRGDMSLKLFRKLKRAGFYRLEYGVESGSKKILKAMRKIFTPQDASHCLKLGKEAGIENILYFIVGFPGETEEDFNKTLDFIKENSKYIDFVKSINPLYIIAGSEMFKRRRDYNINLPKKNSDIYWTSYDGNNFELRMERVEKVKDLLRELNISFTEEATALPRKTIVSTKRDKRVCLVTTPPWGVSNPPVGIAYLASFVKNYGYEPIVFDYNIKFFHKADKGFENLWHVENKNFWSDPAWFQVLRQLFKKEIDEAVEEILNTEAPIIGFSVVDPKERFTIEFIRKIKEKDKKRKIILGGPACLTNHSRKIFLDNILELIDYLVVGEGEETLVEILKNNGGSEIKGAISRIGNKRGYQPRELIKNLDKIPFPTYEDFDIKLYPSNSLILEWSRGCRGKCAFCINWVLINGYRTRSAEHIFQELRYHVSKNKIRKFTICDPLLNGNPKILSRLCDLILEEGLDIEWTGEAAPRNDMDIEFLKKMYKAGCHKLQIGVESGSDKVLAKMRKIYNSKQAEKFLKNASCAGMETEVFIMIGFPGEGEEEFQETVDFIKRNKDYINTVKSINTMHLIAGTDVYENKEKYNIKSLPKENWHYLWQTYDGNNYEVRRRRGEFLLNLAKELGFKVLETNLSEGKQEEEVFANVENLKIKINKLQDLPERKKKKISEPILPRRRLVKLPYLILILMLTIVVEFYLWALKKLRGWIIFPGS
jgi:radical SAM superfamily enzyme YgiQ (UPF0313 family)